MTILYGRSDQAFVGVVGFRAVWCDTLLAFAGRFYQGLI